MSLAGWWKGGRRRRLGDHEIFVREGGPGGADGHTTFLHGFPTSSYDWAPLLDGPEPPRRRWLALDFLGFGASDKPRRHRYRLTEQADLVEAAWRDAGVTPQRIVAHDYGVSVAQELLARGHDLEHVCFLNGGLIPALHRPVRVQRLLAGPLGPALSRLTTERTLIAGLKQVMPRPPSDLELHEHWLAVRERDGHRRSHDLLAYLAERRANADRWVGVLRTTSTALSFVWGPLDPVSGAHAIAGVRELRPDADVVELPGVGHYPQLEATQDVRDALRARDLL